MTKYEKLSLIQFGQQHPDFTFEDFKLILQLKRLNNKHQRYCEYACNGVGWIKGIKYTADSKKWYVSKDKSVFDVEITKLEKKIKSLLPEKYSVEFQQDPRGCTVKVKYGEGVLNWSLF